MSTALPPADSSDDPHGPLVDRALDGDRAGLDALCRALSGPVYRLALRMLGHPQDAEDASQEVLVQVVTHLSTFRRESRVLTWVYTIATRHLLRRRKGHRERQIRTQRLAEHIDAGLALTSPRSTPEGEVRVLAREVRLACTQSMLMTLSREERVALVLVEILGARNPLGAQICEVSTTTFRQRLSRARSKLRPILEARCGLRDERYPCRCPRQAAAKQQAGIEPDPVWTKLPTADARDIAAAQDQLQAAHRWGPVFAWDPPILPPKALWKTLSAHLDAVL